MLKQYRLHPSYDEGLIMPFLASDSSAQTSAFRQASARVSGIPHEDPKLLEIGPGDGTSLARFRELRPSCRWVGVDVPDSPEVRQVARRVNCVTYDGVRLPFPDDVFDLTYTRQVFEHVEFPSELILEIHRVLRPGGRLVGSTSHLEPYHSRSLQNFTPLGFALMLKRSGFDGITLRPGIDGFSLMIRRPLSRLGLRFIESYFESEAPLNRLAEIGGRAIGLSVERRSALKLLFSGHFVFEATKGGPTRPSETVSR
jgi:SAM-dependent methyltransferase